MGMGIWWKNERTGVPKFLGPRDGLNLENSTWNREISAPQCQIRAQNLNKQVFAGLFSLFCGFGGVPLGGAHPALCYSTRMLIGFLSA